MTPMWPHGPQKAPRARKAAIKRQGRSPDEIGMDLVALTRVIAIAATLLLTYGALLLAGHMEAEELLIEEQATHSHEQ